MTALLSFIEKRLGRDRERLLALCGERRLFVVGGALRDFLLDREPDDFDFTVSGSGLEFAAAFARRVRGRLVVLSEPDDEARVISRGRVFDFNGFGAGSIETDLGRRDFTVNAMACELGGEETGRLIDPLGGQADLAAGVLRPVSAGSLRSDPLRLLRALRLGLELGLAVDDAVYEQGRLVSLERVAGERVAAELLRIAEQPASLDAVVKLYELGRLVEILPVLGPVLQDDKLRRHSLKTYAKIEGIVNGGSFFHRFEPEWQRYFECWGAGEEEPEAAHREDGRKIEPPRPPRRSGRDIDWPPSGRAEPPRPPTRSGRDIDWPPSGRAEPPRPPTRSGRDIDWPPSGRVEPPESPGRSGEQNARQMEPGEAAPAGRRYRRALLKLAGLLHDVAKPETRFTNDSGDVHFYGHDSLGARAVARMARDRLRLSRAQVKMLRTLVQEHMRLHLLATTPDLSDRAIRRFFRDLGEEALGLMILCYADGWATAGRTYHLEDTITRMFEQKRAEDARIRVERFVTGHDLIALGMKPGPAFKVILQELEELQLDGRLADREAALDYLKANLPGLAGGQEPNRGEV